MRNVFDVGVYLTAVFAAMSAAMSDVHAAGTTTSAASEAAEYATPQQPRPPRVDWATQLQVSPETAQQVSNILRAARANGEPTREAVRAPLQQVLTPDQMATFRSVMQARHAARQASVQGVSPRGAR